MPEIGSAKRRKLVPLLSVLVELGTTSPANAVHLYCLIPVLDLCASSPAALVPPWKNGWNYPPDRTVMVCLKLKNSKIH